MCIRSNWGPIAYMIAFIPTSYFFDVFGLRIASLVAAVLVAAGCGVRLLALTHGANDLAWVAAGDDAHTCVYLAEHPSLCKGAVSADNVTAAHGYASRVSHRAGRGSASAHCMSVQ